MALWVGDCPRCKAKNMTFDVESYVFVRKFTNFQDILEVSAQCRQCRQLSILLCLSQNHDHSHKGRIAIAAIPDDLENHFKFQRLVTNADIDVAEAPEHTPSDIKQAFEEGAKCLAVGCNNASGAMFRLALDLSSKSLLPEEGSPDINYRQRTNLADRLNWLFDNRHWPESLRELAVCIRLDGNDGAHDGALGIEDAEDLMDFTYLLLEKIYTEPARIEASKARREARRTAAKV
ncbi:DUF4145 domain-containing protein [Shewanella sp. 3B26]|uniref:DUF4145 domain-containing protein n=1 Tax=Shewanella zhuhaiensis TaxID=2919576 RepID=A0AAJ1EYZ5_9GAMM|nr:DUF4145 domain-containing protein [Shewanella zhuhaiensis]MCH4295594.1 DUF4145 domain-containing protein [Shewanella zhuhaiensis]